MTDLTTNQEEWLEALCRVLGMPRSLCDTNPHGALITLSQLYSVPAQNERSIRSDMVNELNSVVEAIFEGKPIYGSGGIRDYGYAIGEGQNYQARFSALGGQMVLYPFLFRDAGSTPEELIFEYNTLYKVTFIMTLLGIGSIGGTAGAGVSNAIKANSVRAGLIAAASRAQAAGSAVVEAAIARAGITTAGAAGIVVAAAVITAYFAMIDRMENIRDAILLKYQIGEATEEQFDAIFTEISAENIVQFDVDQIQRYW